MSFSSVLSLDHAQEKLKTPYSTPEIVELGKVSDLTDFDVSVRVP